MALRQASDERGVDHEKRHSVLVGLGYPTLEELLLWAHRAAMLGNGWQDDSRTLR